MEIEWVHKMKKLKPPAPWFGGKARAAPLVWERFGPVDSYVEPFDGMLGVLIQRPTPFRGVETVNDIDGFICNVWRAIRLSPEAVADHADWPVIESDLHARHAWLVSQCDSLTARLEGDPEFFDAKIAGWWLWGLSCWIGSGWCSGKGPWQVVEVDDGSRQLVHLGSAGQGVNRKREGHREALFAYMRDLSARLRHVRVCCGDWLRVMGDAPMFPTGRGNPNYRVGVFIDPPYGTAADRDPDLYRVDSTDIAPAVREWAISHGDDRRFRIALCGYDGEHEMPKGCECISWKSGQGYGSQSMKGYKNKKRERIWF